MLPEYKIIFITTDGCIYVFYNESNILKAEEAYIYCILLNINNNLRRRL